MPPVAKFHEVLDELMRQKAGGITSWRALARHLHELDPQRQTMDNWKSTINRYRRDEANPNEETIRLFARAFGVPRKTFPPAVRRQNLLEERVAVLEKQIARLQGVEDDA